MERNIIKIDEAGLKGDLCAGGQGSDAGKDKGRRAQAARAETELDRGCVRQRRGRNADVPRAPKPALAQHPDEQYP